MGSLNDEEKKLFCRMAEVFAGFSEYTDVQVGRIVDFLEKTGQLDNTIIFYCADNGASGEGTPNGSVNENKFFNGYPDESRGEHELLRRARRPGHLQPLPHRLGGRVLHAVPDVQALLAVRRRHVRPAGHPLAEGNQGQGRDAPPVPPLHRHRADDPRGRWVWRCPRSTAASSSTRSTGCRCATASTTPMRRPPRSGSTSRCSALAASGRTAGRPPPCMPRSAARAISTRTSGSSTTSTRTAPRRATSPAVPGEAAGAHRRLVRRGRGEFRSAP